MLMLLCGPLGLTDETGRIVRALRETHPLRSVCVRLDPNVPPDEIWLETPRHRVRVTNIKTEA